MKDLDLNAQFAFAFVALCRGLATARDIAEVNISGGSALVEMGLEPPAEIEGQVAEHSGEFID